jgi:hypothetical protein
MAYSEHVGTNLQDGGNSGDKTSLYVFSNERSIVFTTLF